MSPSDAAFQLWKDLERRHLLTDMLAMAIVEQGREPTLAYAAELTAYLRTLSDPNSIRMQRTCLAKMLHAFATEHNGPTFLQLMRQRDKPTDGSGDR
ncbi:MAG TPA: hypothetical protein VGP44_05060 [Gemmatimonadales bacterium]|nr:hypothetical protein [Gemmatimonadales bacterium]